jgi:crotonobetainyl-CoA:carnitine CoA-transferase CaiB-like acyl-CoA transferase
LVQRERTGRGDRLDVTMLQSMLYVNEHVHNHLWDRSVPEGVVRSFGNADYPVLTVANGEQIIVSGHPAENGTFEGLVSTMDRPDLGNDPRLATMALRLQHLDEWQAEIDSWAASVPDAATAEAALARHGVTAGVVRSVVDVAASEWAAEREAIVAVDDRNGGTVRVPNVPWVFEHSDVRLRGLPRYRGEDNAEVLGELGYTTDEIDALSEAGALSRRVPELPG